MSSVELPQHPSRNDEEIACAAETSVPVLITSPDRETRHNIARTIHERSLQTLGPFIIIDCAEPRAALPAAPVFDTQSAVRLDIESRKGTLFLDEIGSLALREQAFLKQFLESRDTGTAARLRVIAGSSVSLLERVHAKQFRDDLFYHLNMIHIGAVA